MNGEMPLLMLPFHVRRGKARHLLHQGGASLTSITPAGKTLIPVVRQLEQWGNEFRPAMKKILGMEDVGFSMLLSAGPAFPQPPPL